MKRKRGFVDTKEDKEIQEAIIARANYSLAVLGMAFVRHGSGKFLNIRSPKRPIKIYTAVS